MIVSGLMFAVGLAVLLIAAELVVRGAVGVAARAGVSPLVVGLTVVAFGTSAPEMVVGVNAALQESPGIVYGNVVGSNIANVLLILGAAALGRPFSADPRGLSRDIATMAGAVVLFLMVALSGTMVAWEGAAFLALLLGYLLWSYWSETRAAASGAPVGTVDAAHIKGAEALDGFHGGPAWTVWSMALLGLAGVVGGAELLVSGAVDMARAFGVSDEVIGLTMVAIGTSLPELATAIAAARRGRNDVALGNVVGSNIFNVLGVMGVTAVTADIPAPRQVVDFDMWVMAAVTVLMIPAVLVRRRLGRMEGFVFILVYTAYIAVQFIGVEAVF